jgi:hypothetical protein
MFLDVDIFSMTAMVEDLPTYSCNASIKTFSLRKVSRFAQMVQENALGTIS